MKQILFVMALLCPILNTAQNTISYRSCTNCPTGENTSNINTIYSYGELTAYTGKDVPPALEPDTPVSGMTGTAALTEK